MSFGKANNMLFKLKEQDDQGNKVGIHLEGDKIYHPGDTIESDVDLRKLVRNKFELVSIDIGTDVPHPVIPGSKPTSSKRNRGAKGKPSPSRSVLNVTEDYPQAKVAGVVVLYNVTTKRFAVKRDGKIVKTMKKIVTLENYLDELTE